MGTTDTATVKEPKLSQQALTLRDNYLDKNIVDNFANVPTFAKLALLQTLDAKYFLYREVGGKQVPYLPHQVTEKALNLAFNFNVDVEIVKDGAQEYKVNGKEILEVTMQVKFTFTDPLTKEKIVRTVYSGHKAYANPATTKADCYKSALSKAYTIVARTFGIGSNMKSGKKEESVEAVETQAYEAAEQHAPAEAPKKSFTSQGPLPY